MPKSKSNKIRHRCPECGSTLTVEYGHIKCTQDLLKHEYPFVFKSWDELPQEEIQKKLSASSRITVEMYHRWTNSDETFECFYNPNEDFSPLTESKVILPDPIQQKISEYILKRRLTNDEYWGQRKVPLLNEWGKRYWGYIEQLEFPKDYQPTERCKFDNSSEGTLPVVFRWEDLE